MASSSTDPSTQKSFKYDVFLSFNGEDTRKGFIDHLHLALEQKGICTFKDDEEIKMGKRISDELIRSIEDSKFHIIVFSKNYASSSWCLDELVKIMDCQRTTEHTAYPIFYDVEPSEILNQSGSVEKAFAIHEKAETAGLWRDALKEAANLAGKELKKTFDGHEAKFIQKIVEVISLDLLSINLKDDKTLIGMEDRVRSVVSSLEIGTDDVRMIGIKGMGGIGKTTLANAIFNQISILFDGSCFVHKVREVSNDSSSGLKSLQKQVLSDVLNDQGINVNNVFDGINKMKIMLRRRKAIVVLDDVDNIEQLKALAGELNWFMPGSRIIITTRDEQVLVSHQVNFIHGVKLLSHEEAICLLSRNAFRTERPIQGYEELSKEVVRYAAGLPLTVSVLGSFLSGRSDLEWKDALERLKTIPLEETLQKLELSYNGLADDFKEIFLDVACILKGWEKNEAIRALESCGFHAQIGLRVLEQKSLITISNYGYLGIHDHIEEMGMNIARRLHPTEPYKHRRLWVEVETQAILAKNLGTQATRYLCLWNIQLHPTIVMKGLGNMKELRFLYVDGSFRYYQNFDEDSQYLPNALRFMCWYRYPFTCLPQKFLANNLVGLQMHYSSIIQLWEGGERKVLKKLKFIDLSNSNLRTLDLGLIPNIETLILRACVDLVELDMQFKCQKLTFLDLSYSKLRALYLGLTPNLETLYLKACDDLLELNMRGGSPKLKFLELSQSKLRIIHLGQSPNLERLFLQDCDDLKELYMPIGSVKLKSFELSYSKLCILNFSQTRNLEKFDLKGCEGLVELHMPAELKFFYLSHSKLRSLDLAPISNLEAIYLDKCSYLVEIRMPRESLMLKSLKLCLSKLRILHLGWSPNLEELLLQGCVDLEELHLPIRTPKLKSFKLSCSKMRILDLSQTRNLECLDLEVCENLVELHVPIELKSLYLCRSKLRTLDLARNTRLETLSLKDCSKLIEIHMPIESLKLKSLHLSHSKLKNLDLAPFSDLERLYLNDCVDLVQLRMPVKNLKLKYLQLSSSIIRTVELTRTPNLQTLYLKNCSDLESFLRSICGLGFLRTLTLEGSIAEVPKDLNLLECLEELNLSSAKITHFPNSICMLKCLKVLQLKCLLVEELPEDLGRLECLEELIMSFTNVKHLPNSICMLKHLKVLRLEFCRLLEQLPEDLGRLKCLEELVLSSNKINFNPYSTSMLKRLPNSICMLKLLKVLKLKCLFVEQLPEDLGKLECLEELIVSHTKIKHLPNSIYMLKCLKVLRLESCMLLEQLLEDLDRLECLEELIVLGTKIKHLPNRICMLKHLKVLRLDRCNFLEQVREDIGRLESLEELSLSSRNVHLYRTLVLKYLPNSICMLKCLKVLKLESCSLLVQLPENIGRLECLEELIVSKSKFKHLPNSICMLKCLKVVKLESCLFLEQLPEDLGRLECLEKLILSSTKIKHVPSSICNLKYVPSSICNLKYMKVLKLESCSLLEQLPEDLGRLECLEELILSSRKIKHLPSSICMLKCLKVLRLESFWSLQRLPDDINRLEYLEELTLSSRIIKHLPHSICMLKRLKVLKLISCWHLKQLPENIGRLESLEELHVTDCIIVDRLPVELEHLECLKVLNIRGADIIHLPESILRLKRLRINY